jgi:hypothetical protein
VTRFDTQRYDRLPLAEKVRATAAVLDEMIRLGGEHLRRTWPGLYSLRQTIQLGLDDLDALGDADNREEFIRVANNALTSMYGGMGSFADYSIAGWHASRFTRLRDELSTMVGRLSVSGMA